MRKRDKLDNLAKELLLEQANNEMPDQLILKKILERMKELEKDKK